MKRKICLGLISILTLSLIGCGTKEPEPVVLLPEPSISETVEEPVVEEIIEEVVEEPDIFESIDYPVWIPFGNTWSLYNEPDKSKEKLFTLDGVIKLDAIGVATIDDKEWLRVVYEDTECYIESKKVITEEPYDLEALQESGEIGDIVINSWGMTEADLTDEDIHPGEDFPFPMYTVLIEDGVEVAYVYADSCNVFSNPVYGELIESQYYKHGETTYKSNVFYGVYKNGTINKITW